jgi:hypothetical protein
LILLVLLIISPGASLFSVVRFHLELFIKYYETSPEGNCQQIAQTITGILPAVQFILPMYVLCAPLFIMNLDTTVYNAESKSYGPGRNFKSFVSSSSFITGTT